MFLFLFFNYRIIVKDVIWVEVAFAIGARGGRVAAPPKDVIVFGLLQAGVHEGLVDGSFDVAFHGLVDAQAAVAAERCC